MAVSSGLPTSRRGYLSQDELAQLADITIIDADEADDRISQAEEMIDSYVGTQERAMDEEITGLATAGTSTTITLKSVHQNVYEINYFKLCEIEILGGTGEGQRRKIISNTKAGVITVDGAWTTTPDATSYYHISQLGKFPRFEDVTYDSDAETYYKRIPEAVKRAVAAQVEFVINMGDTYFASDKMDKVSESIGDYSYSKGNQSGRATSLTDALIASKAKSLLRGILNRCGTIV